LRAAFPQYRRVQLDIRTACDINNDGNKDLIKAATFNPAPDLIDINSASSRI